ncbi:Hypothetical predicted protein, partial [Olea europaea subsp. europaea]
GLSSLASGLLPNTAIEFILLGERFIWRFDGFRELSRGPRQERKWPPQRRAPNAMSANFVYLNTRRAHNPRQLLAPAGAS